MRHAIPATLLALAGGAALLTLPSALRAEESTHDAVERLMPQLLSEDDTQRADAEKSLFALGDAGRAELERITRENDPRRAITALRLLQSPKWPKSGKASGEQRAEREDAQQESDPNVRIDDLRSQMQRQIDEMRRRFEDFDRDFDARLPHFDLRQGLEGGVSNGVVVENDRKTTWSIDARGRVKVTVQDGKDAPEQKFEADSLDALRKEHPDVAKRIEPSMGRDWVTIRKGDRGLGLLPDRPSQLGRGERADPFELPAPETPVLGISWSPVPDVLRDQLDVGTGGMVVEGVVEKSLAAKLGLSHNDVLLEIQGKPVAGSPDVRAALEPVKDGEKVTALVVRKGQRKTLEVTK